MGYEAVVFPADGFAGSGQVLSVGVAGRDVLETSIEDGTPYVDLEPGFEVFGWRHVADFIEDDSRRGSVVAETRESYTNKEDRTEWT